MNFKSVAPKYSQTISNKQIYTKTDGQINISLVKQMLYEGYLIDSNQLILIIKKFQHLIKNQPNIIKVNDPVIVVGDIHGQFFDLLKVLALFSQDKINSEKSIDQTDSSIKRQTAFVFLGDYVDRGIMSVEVMSLLMLMKIAAPKNVILLRGNHESRIMTELYNFKQECNEKYGQQVYDLFVTAFDSLPLACIVNEKYFCVHGGITDQSKTIEEIQKIQRCKQIPLQGTYCDLIWSDPTPIPSGKMKSKTSFNESRQCSIYYGADLADQFLKENNLRTIIRGHEVLQQGFKSYNWLNREAPQVITIFSAPNYCNSYGNKGTVMRIDSDKIKIRQYNQQIPENYRLADKLEVFNWSLNYIFKTLNNFSSCMLDRICELYLEDLKNEKPEKKLSAFLYYHDQNTSKFSKKPEEKQNKKRFSLKQIEDQQKDKIRTQQEEREYLFNRSQQYYKESDKIPKINRFKNASRSIT